MFSSQRASKHVVAGRGCFRTNPKCSPKEDRPSSAMTLNRMLPCPSTGPFPPLTRIQTQTPVL